MRAGPASAARFQRAEADRPLKIFRELHLARQWLDAQLSAEESTPSS